MSYKISRRFAASIGVALFLLILFFTVLEYLFLRHRIIEEGFIRTKIVLAEVEAIQTYVRETLRPEVAQLVPPHAFIPQAMSTTYVSRQITETFIRNYPEFYFKFAALDPRNPLNAADEFEREMLHTFAANPDMSSWRGTVRRGGRIMLVYLTPIRMEESCLRCHGDPEDAPLQLREIYGSQRGFHRKVGEVVSLRSAAIPIEFTLVEARRLIGWNLGLAILGLSLLLIATNLAFRRLIMTPLTTLMDFAAAVGRGSDRPPPSLPDNEMGELGRSLDSMQRQIRDHTTAIEARNIELTRAQEDLRVAHSSLSGLFETIPEGILVINRDMRVADINPAACRLLGIAKKADAVGSDCRSACSPPRSGEADGSAICPAGEAMRTGVVSRTVHAGAGPAGEQTFEIIASPLRDRDGAVTQVIELIRDTTESSRVQEAVEKKNAELEAFIYTLSHDLKAPLANIKGFVDILEEAGADPSQLPFIHSRIRYNVGAMNRLITDLLELSRIGLLTEPRESVSVREVVDEAVSLFETQIRERGVSVSVAPDLPVVQFTRRRLLQVFVNLIGNAVAYGTEGEDPLIEVGVNQLEGVYYFWVKDNGPGIESADQTRIFEPFSSPTRSGSTGSGLGLTIVKRIIERNGGRVWVKSRPGEGASFFFTVTG